MAEPPTADLLGLNDESPFSAPSRPPPPLPGRAPVPAKPQRSVNVVSNNHQGIKEKPKPITKPGGRPRPVIEVLDARPMSEVGFRAENGQEKSNDSTAPKPSRPVSLATGDTKEPSPPPRSSHKETAPSIGAENNPPVPMRRESVKRTSPDTAAPGKPARPKSGPPMSPTRPPPPTHPPASVDRSSPPAPARHSGTKFGVLIPGLADPPPQIPNRSASLENEEKKEPEKPTPSPRIERKSPPDGAPPSPKPRPKPRPTSVIQTTDGGSDHKQTRPHSIMVLPSKPKLPKPISHETESNDQNAIIDARASLKSTVSKSNEAIHETTIEGHNVDTGFVQKKGPTIIRPASMHKEQADVSAGETNLNSEKSKSIPPKVLEKPKVAAKPTLAPKPKLATKPKIPPDKNINKETTHSMSTDSSSSESLSYKQSSISEKVSKPTEGEASENKDRVNNVKESIDSQKTASTKPTIINFPKLRHVAASEPGNEDFSSQSNVTKDANDNENKPVDEIEKKYSEKPLPHKPTIIGFPRLKHVDKNESNDGEQSIDDKPSPPKPEKKRPTFIGRPKSKVFESEKISQPAEPSLEMLKSETEHRKEPERPPSPKREEAVDDQMDKSCSQDNLANHALASVMLGRKSIDEGVPLVSETKRGSVDGEESQVEKKSPPSRPPPVKTPPTRPGAPPPARPKAPDDKKKSPSRPKSEIRPAPVKPPRVSPGAKQKSPPPLPKRPGPGHPLHHYTITGPYGIAVYDYNATQADELSFKAGDVIELLYRVDQEWIQGRYVDKEGMFPQGFIDIMEAPPNTPPQGAAKHHTSPKSEEHQHGGTGPRCVARFDFEGENSDDLAFTSGQVISLVERVGEEWLRGSLGGKTGVFPLAFVEIIEDLPRDTQPHDNTVSALFDYTGEEHDLSFRAGDKIKVLYKIDMQWLHGEMCGKTGDFPATFVDRIPTNLPEKPLGVTHISETASKTKSEQYCTATYKFEGEHDGDLKFNVGDRIKLVEQIDSEWWRGSLHGNTGIFPAAFVKLEEVHSKNQVTVEHTPNKGEAKALYEFPGESAGDLPLKVGDIIKDLERIDAEWLRGTTRGHSGIFPAAFVEIIREPIK